MFIGGIFFNVGQTILNHPPVITMFIGGINLPFPVMGGKNGIVLPGLGGPACTSGISSKAASLSFSTTAFKGGPSAVGWRSGNVEIYALKHDNIYIYI